MSWIASIGKIWLQVVVVGGLYVEAVVVTNIGRNTTHYSIGVQLLGRCVNATEEVGSRSEALRNKIYLAENLGNFK